MCVELLVVQGSIREALPHKLEGAHWVGWCTGVA